MINDFFHVMMQVPAVGIARAAWERWLGFEAVEEGPLRRTLADSWRAPELAGSASVLLRPASGVASYVRLVEGAAFPALGALGWNGLELHVQDLAATERALAGSPFETFSPPQTLSMSPNVRFMQVLGPAGELIFLNEMNEPGFGVGSASSAVDRPFIATCGARDVAKILDWFQSRFGMTVPPTQMVTMPALNRIFGFTEGTQHPLGMVKLGGGCILEFDGYPDLAATRPVGPSGLPAGIGIVSCSVADLGSLADGMPVHRHADAPYDGARSALVEGPEGLLIELVERPSTFMMAP